MSEFKAGDRVRFGKLDGEVVGRQPHGEGYYYFMPDNQDSHPLFELDGLVREAFTSAGIDPKHLGKKVRYVEEYNLSGPGGTLTFTNEAKPVSEPPKPAKPKVCGAVKFTFNAQETTEPPKRPSFEELEAMAPQGVSRKGFARAMAAMISGEDPTLRECQSFGAKGIPLDDWRTRAIMRVFEIYGEVSG